MRGAPPRTAGALFLFFPPLPLRHPEYATGCDVTITQSRSQQISQQGLVRKKPQQS